MCVALQPTAKPEKTQSKPKRNAKKHRIRTPTTGDNNPWFMAISWLLLFWPNAVPNNLKIASHGIAFPASFHILAKHYSTQIY